jgi:uncharacterized protein (TIGR02246 family)
MIRAGNSALLVATTFVGLFAWAGGTFAASSDEAAIRAQTTDFMKAYNGGDAKAVTALYTEDALVLPPGSAGVKGRAAILAFFTKDIADTKAGGATLVIDTKTDVGVAGNTGWESGTFKVVVKGQTVDTGKFLSVSHKQNGKWLYYRDTWNMDSAPPPAASPAPASASAAPAAPAKK